MVPGPRIRESRSPLDSRGPLPKWRGASSFYTDRSALRLHSRHRGLSVHAACGSQPPRGKPPGGLFFFVPHENCCLPFEVSDWRIRNQIHSRQNISYNKILDRDVTKGNFELESFKKNIGLNLSFVRKNDGFFYELSLNETGLIDGVKIYSFEKDVDLWNFIEKVRSRNDLRVKEDKDEIIVSLQKTC